MAEIGKINRLTVKRVRDYGVHLDGGESGDILLPYKYVAKDCQAGDEVEVFVYQDKENHLRATTSKPFATVGQFARLRVAAKSSAGAFLDWGMQKDLLLPKSEQPARLDEGKAYNVYIFLDEKSGRITASAKLDKFLDRKPASYEEGEEVSLFILEKTELGYRAVVNHAHTGMLYKNEIFQPLSIGQELKGYIKKIREDGKLDLCLQQGGYGKIDDVSKRILDTIRNHGGKIKVTDKTPPEEIYTLFGISKKVFKKAVGALYKKRLITMDDFGIKLIR
ncbi:MAG: GntR family transcriptional regulator [Proteobacteria bacterium]|nr:GntR family transcriptional regulator [Pseudomonadota bacterium]MBU1737420.1 GntR family transcriptional regulator [Pseudomonadota bacterium]